ncbi:hypothetical protein [Yoonia litorea]|uniref:Uncharacterized protein n=1 Tax=Yoonia litorea TaxID=1123755 RepID=A0A1I6LL50_9RHOB|nr:hypothetical protein [Yoonia litorea]SFS04111.1 hypothetical protein SAMN05444714_0635 [Yoonia litorea]
MFQPDKDGIYARVQASAGRRLFAYGVLFSLGALVIYTTLSQPPAMHWMIFMLVFGVAMLWLAERLRRATQLEIVLTEDKVTDSSGALLAHLDEIVSVSRGAFALKPSNGFTLVMRSRGPRAWVPGLWWRMGRRVGVGGVTSAGQSKFMAEQIALRIKQRDG